MDALFDRLPLLLGGLALSVPVVFMVAALLDHRADGLRRARFASGYALFAAPLLAAGIAALPPGAPLLLPVRLDLLTAVMSLLVAGLGAVITRYSRTYLAGDPGLPRAERWLLVTLGAVTLLVTTRDLLVLALAWTVTSIALHQLLTFYPDRTAAVVAAHKKFIISRLADVFLWSAIALVSHTTGSMDLDVLARFVQATPALPLPLEVAAVFFVVAAAMKSAQLPFHGWLTQVMEAPTPVSALLHAGVVNLGGFLMIRLSPLMGAALGAQWLLLGIGLTTTLLAALVMTTRVSIKLALAWSTIAQMGFMLVQCALGAWHLALLHLVAHSLYKAHAFLAAGSTVSVWKARALLAKRTPTRSDLLVAGGLSLAVTGAALLAATASGLRHDATVLPLAVLLGLGLVSLNLRATVGGRAARSLLGTSVLVAALYFAWHVLAERALPPPAAPNLAAWAVVVAGFGALFAVQVTLQLQPQGRLARALHPWLFSGLFLDEGFTRLTFRAWPPRLVPASGHAGLVASVEA